MCLPGAHDGLARPRSRPYRSGVKTILLSAVLLAPALSVMAEEPAAFIELPYDYVIGGHADGKWRNTEQAGRTLNPGAEFRIFTLKGEAGKMTVKKAAPMEDVCTDVWVAETEPDKDMRGIAVAARWNPMPRTARPTATTQDVYITAVSAILTEQGIRKPEVKITQILRVDVEGDGEDEVLLSATHYRSTEGLGNVPTSAGAGNYSFVALRRVVDGKVTTQILDGEFYDKAKEFNAPNVHEVGAILDLDGDGKMEIILHSQYYEGGATTVWKLGPKEAVKVLEVGCGV